MIDHGLDTLDEIRHLEIGTEDRDHFIWERPKELEDVFLNKENWYFIKLFQINLIFFLQNLTFWFLQQSHRQFYPRKCFLCECLSFFIACIKRGKNSLKNLQGKTGIFFFINYFLGNLAKSSSSIVLNVSRRQQQIIHLNFIILSRSAKIQLFFQDMSQCSILRRTLRTNSDVRR